MKTSTNDYRDRHPYLDPRNWLPGGKCCFWDTLRKRHPDYCEKQDKRMAALQTRPKENLIINNRNYERH